MKNLFMTILFLFSLNVSAQKEKLYQKLTIDNLQIELKVSSESELKTFNISDLKSIIKELDENSNLEFKITLNRINSDLKNSISYNVKGNTNDTKTFYKMISKIKRSAVKYYKS